MTIGIKHSRMLFECLSIRGYVCNNLTMRDLTLTKEVTEKIVSGIKSHLTIRLAAELAGVTKEAAYKWLQLGRIDHEHCHPTPQGQFFLAVKRARAEAAVTLLERIESAGKKPKHWQASAWLLERINREDYGIHGDKFEQIQQQIEDLNLRLDKKQGVRHGIETQKEIETLDSQSD